MPDSRSWQERFQDIIDAAESVEAYIAGISEEEFDLAPQIVDAVVRNLIIVGEAIARLDADKQESMPHINWREFVMPRNFLVHEYFLVNSSMVWDAAALRLPRLVPQLRAELDAAGEASA